MREAWKYYRSVKKKNGVWQLGICYQGISGKKKSDYVFSWEVVDPDGITQEKK